MPGIKRVIAILVWGAVACLGAAAYGVIALTRGETLNAAWLLLAALCTYAIGLRFYSKWIAAKVLTLNDLRAPPAEAHEDGRDFVKTNKWIVFGHHFASISGPGPLVGPVLAAQFGYLPGALWILIGVVLGGAVQDFLILFCSMRRDGKSLVEMVREEIHSAAGKIGLVAVLSILIVLLAGLGFVVTNALAESPWGVVTTALTIPFAMLMGLYLRYLRPGKMIEITGLGILLLLIALWLGQRASIHPVYGPMFTWSKQLIALSVIGYGFTASVLPVWLLLAPRDYLVTFLKIGTVFLLAFGIVLVLPPLHMPALTQFVDGTGPVVPGKVFPFCFITIACGAISGFHSLVSSGTTPKMITRERYARPIGYGAMCMESFVAIMALIAACVLEPGAYFAINSPAGIVGTNPSAVAAKITGWGFEVRSEQIQQLASDIGEKTVLARTGGAPTLAIGMAAIFARAFGGAAMAFWYHFAIMFEAMFILTTVDVATRIGRFLLQELGARIYAPLGRARSYPANIAASLIFSATWGYLLWAAVNDPHGGIKTLWALFGIANQLLAVIALCLATTVLIKMNRARYAWVPLLPMAWLISVTFSAAYQKLFNPSPLIGFRAMAAKIAEDITTDKIPADKIASAQAQMIFNCVSFALAAIFLTLVVLVLLISVWEWLMILARRKSAMLRETPPVWLRQSALEAEHAPRGLGWLWACLIIGVGLVKEWSGQSAVDRAAKAHPSMQCAIDQALEQRYSKGPTRCC